jgi:hypothetical protein
MREPALSLAAKNYSVYMPKNSGLLPAATNLSRKRKQGYTRIFYVICVNWAKYPALIAD